MDFIIFSSLIVKRHAACANSDRTEEMASLKQIKHQVRLDRAKWLDEIVAKGNDQSNIGSIGHRAEL